MRPRIGEWSLRNLHIHFSGSPEDKRMKFLLRNSDHESNHSLTLLALPLAAVYSVHNKCRHGARANSQERLNMFTHNILDMAEGCRFSMRCGSDLRS